MDPALRRAWTGIVTPYDYERHMAAIGQAQAAADLTRYVLERAALPEGARVVIADAGTGQMLDYLDPAILRPYRLTCTDLNPRYLARLQERLARCGLESVILEDDIEHTAIEPAPGLLFATLLLEHIDWRRGVEVFASLRPMLCALTIQENPAGMSTAVTPGRQLPPSLLQAMADAHPTLIPIAELQAEFAARGYRCRETRAIEVADGKRLIALMFTSESGGVQ